MERTAEECVKNQKNPWHLYNEVAGWESASASINRAINSAKRLIDRRAQEKGSARDLAVIAFNLRVSKTTWRLFRFGAADTASEDRMIAALRRYARDAKKGA